MPVYGGRNDRDLMGCMLLYQGVFLTTGLPCVTDR